MIIKLGAKELRKSRPTKGKIAKINRNPIYIVLDNVLDTYNVGAIFRLADAVAARKIFLCGETATPEDPKVGHKIEKASVGTYKWVKWKYVRTAKEAVIQIRNPKHEILNKFQIPNSKFQTQNKLKVKSEKLKVIAVEQSPKSVPYTEAKYEFPLVIVVGNETNGVSKDVLEIADMIVEIPMWGVNRSLNVMVSLAIVLYKVMDGVVE